MKVGIVGAGRIGSAIAAHCTRVGIDVVVANSRGPQSLTELVAELGDRASAGTVAQAAATDVVVLALPFKDYVTLPADALAGRIVVDAMNYYPPRDGQISELDDDSTTSTELVAHHLDRSRVVKAFNTIRHVNLVEDNRELGDPHRLAIPVAADDEDAKAVVSDLIEHLGFAAVDNRGLAEGGRRQQPGSSIYGNPVVYDAALAIMRLR